MKLEETDRVKWETSASVHEAAHFVFAEMLGLGPVVSLTMGHSTWKDGGRYAPVCTRDVGIFETLLEQDNAGRPLEECFHPKPPPAVARQIAAQIDLYRREKKIFATALLFYAVAGAAADIELNGDAFKVGGGYSPSDEENARKAALGLVRPSEVSAKIADALSAARVLCRGALRPAILAAAQQLRELRILDTARCAALWLKISPTIGWIAQLPCMMRANPDHLFSLPRP